LFFGAYDERQKKLRYVELRAFAGIACYEPMAAWKD